MHLSNWRDNRSYNIEKYVYKNNVSNIWCGIGSDSKRHKVFVKILNYGNFLDASMTLDFVNAFEQEAITLKRVSECSNAVPKLYDSWNDRKNKKYIIVMKMVPGISLRKWLDTHKKNELQAKDIFVRKCIIIQLCEIMRDINNKYSAIVHRDLKPENIFVNFNANLRRWEVYIVDFGCANLNHIRYVGTKNYQAPEQIGKKNTKVTICNKTDIFAIGQIFYEMLLGEPPKIGIDYLSKANEKQWIQVPEMNSYLLQIQGVDKIQKVLEDMTRFDMNDRCIYERIITNLKNIRVG